MRPDHRGVLPTRALEPRTPRKSSKGHGGPAIEGPKGCLHWARWRNLRRHPAVTVPKPPGGVAPPPQSREELINHQKRGNLDDQRWADLSGSRKSRRVGSTSGGTMTLNSPRTVRDGNRLSSAVCQAARSRSERHAGIEFPAPAFIGLTDGTVGEMPDNEFGVARRRVRASNRRLTNRHLRSSPVLAHDIGRARSGPGMTISRHEQFSHD